LSSAADERPSLRRRLLTLLVRWFALYLLVALALSVFAFQRSRDDAVAERLLLARTVARYLDSTLAAVHRNMDSLAASLPALDDSAVPRLRSFRFQCLFRDAIFVLDGEGRVLVADPSYAAPPATGWLDGRPRVTTLLIADGGRPGLAIAEPFHRDGSLFYVVAEMYPVGSAVSTFLQDLDLGDDFHAAVVDSAGAVIAAADQGRLFQQVPQADALAAKMADDETWVDRTRRCVLCDEHESGPFLSVMVPLMHAPWGVLVQQDEGSAYASLYTLQSGVLGTGLLLALMAALLFRALSRSVVAPIGDLSEQAEELRRGNLARPITVSGDREIVVLADTLEAARRRLAATLDELTSLNETLEAQVAERTRALRVRDVQRRTLVRRLMAAGEEERRRIARELHDEISQLLTVIQLSLDRVPVAAGGDGAREMEKAMSLLEKTQKEVHRVIFDLRPSLLDDLGLAAAVKWYARNYLEPAGLDVRLEVEEDMAVPPTVEITAFRIYQEIVTNILRHAGAETVSVELYLDDGSLVLGVEDDGKGFDPTVEAAGAGIVGMRERAELVGGSLVLDSEAGLGTHVRLEIPLESWREEKR
jgi:signal transduction histidine kinase